MDGWSLFFSIIGTLLSGLGLYVTCKTLQTVKKMKEHQRKIRERKNVISFIENKIMKITGTGHIMDLDSVQKKNCKYACDLLESLDDKTGIEKNLKKLSRFLLNDENTIDGLLNLFTAIHEELTETEVE